MTEEMTEEDCKREFERNLRHLKITVSAEAVFLVLFILILVILYGFPLSFPG